MRLIIAVGVALGFWRDLGIGTDRCGPLSHWPCAGIILPGIVTWILLSANKAGRK